MTDPALAALVRLSWRRRLYARGLLAAIFLGFVAGPIALAALGICGWGAMIALYLQVSLYFVFMAPYLLRQERHLPCAGLGRPWTLSTRDHDFVVRAHGRDVTLAWTAISRATYIADMDWDTVPVLRLDFHQGGRLFVHGRAEGFYMLRDELSRRVPYESVFLDLDGD